MIITTTVPLECHRCNLTIPVGEEVTLTDDDRALMRKDQGDRDEEDE